MGNHLFGEDIAGELARELGPGFLPFRLLKRQVGERTAGSLASGPSVTYRPARCRGILDTYVSKRAADTIPNGTPVALILGDTLPKNVVPEIGDRLVAEGSTYDVVGPIVRDPDAATYLFPITD